MLVHLSFDSCTHPVTQAPQTQESGGAPSVLCTASFSVLESSLAEGSASQLFLEGMTALMGPSLGLETRTGAWILRFSSSRLLSSALDPALSLPVGSQDLLGPVLRKSSEGPPCYLTTGSAPQMSPGAEPTPALAHSWCRIPQWKIRAGYVLSKPIWK